jgi:hypothetical protein
MAPLIKEYNNQVLAARLDRLLFKAVLKTQVNFTKGTRYSTASPEANGLRTFL